jgi:hypothetical protein
MISRRKSRRQAEAFGQCPGQVSREPANVANQDLGSKFTPKFFAIFAASRESLFPIAKPHYRTSTTRLYPTRPRRALTTRETTIITTQATTR